MSASFLETLAAFDPKGAAGVTGLEAALAAFADGEVLKEDVRTKFWNRAKSDDTPAITLSLVRCYLAVRREYLRSSRSREFRSDLLDLEVRMMVLLQDIGECIEHCLGEVAQMLLDEDQGIYFVACKMLAGSPCRRFVSADTILEALSRRGVRELPFTLGRALVKASDYDQELAETLVGAIDGDKNVNAAVLSILAELPVDKRLKHAKACQVAQRLRPWSGADWNCEACAALKAIAKIGIVTTQASAIIERALESGEWHIRAQAAQTAGELRINPTEVVPKLISLLDDKEGYGYTVQDSVIQGLGQYGSAAREALEALTALKASLASDDEAAERSKEIETAIARIREN